MPGARESSSATRNTKQKNKTSLQVENVKKLIVAYGRGYRLIGREVCRRTLYLNEYKQLLEEIKDDSDLLTIYNYKLRYDYTADNRGKTNKRKEQLAIRMPTKFHQYLSEAIKRAITVQKELVRMGKAECGTGKCRGEYCKDFYTRRIARNLNGQDNDTVKSSAEEESDKRDPDLSFKYNYPGSTIPGLVVEVGWSQKSSELHEKCRWYIEKTHGAVRTVIGVDLFDLYECYPKIKTKPNGPSDDEKKKATKKDKEKMADATARRKALGKIFVWRANIDGDTGKVIAVPDAPIIFRDKNGRAFGEVALSLSLEDFVSERIMRKIGPLHNPEFLLTALGDQISWDREQERKSAKREREETEQKEQKEHEKKKAYLQRRLASPKVSVKRLQRGMKRIT
ncbi:hypothetical protein F5Y12DRAFT_788950 [Xylaria sp. FL1777]|nr:hypothetical protein F5Y12DRAFT_788950 [Xylaria sp. FL1777]